MHLYLVTQSSNNDYDTYDSMVVAAQSPTEAKQKTVDDYHRETYSPWAPLNELKSELIGEAHNKYTTPTIILASFNAG